MASQNMSVNQLDEQFSKQISQQLQKATAELNHLEQLLKAGMVDRAVLTDFRESVNRVRHTGWAVQQAMEAPESGDDVQLILTMERVRASNQLSTQLASDLNLMKTGDAAALDRSKLKALIQSVRLLESALHNLLHDNPLEL